MVHPHDNKNQRRNHCITFSGNLDKGKFYVNKHLYHKLFMYSNATYFKYTWTNCSILYIVSTHVLVFMSGYFSFEMVLDKYSWDKTGQR